MSDAAASRNGEGHAPAALRWGLCIGLILLIHGAAWMALNRVAPEAAVTVPVNAIMVDLAPVAEAPPTPPEPEPPKLVETPPVTPPPEPPPPEPIPPEPTPEPPPPIPVPVVPPAPEPEVVLPAPKPILKPRPVKPVVRPPVVAVPVPQAAPSPPITSASPAPPAATPSPQVTATWQDVLIAHIARFKRYPAMAQRRGDQGVAYVRFVMDRDGAVLSATLDRGSGHAELDQEAIAWLQRAQPLPKPPPDIARDRMELVLPMRFQLQ